MSSWARAAATAAARVAVFVRATCAPILRRAREALKARCSRFTDSSISAACACWCWRCSSLLRRHRSRCC
eukprot:2283-Heterococcus_DN1.PRE.1